MSGKAFCPWPCTGLTEARIEELAERFRAPAAAPAPVSADATEWPDLAAPAPGPSNRSTPSEPAGTSAPSDEDFPALGSSTRASAPASSNGRGSISHASSAVTLASEHCPAQHAQHDDDGVAKASGSGRELGELHQNSNGSLASVARNGGAAAASSGGKEDEDIDLGPGMFDEDAAGMLNVPVQQKGSIADAVAPWGGYGGPTKKKGFKLKSAPPSFLSQ